uniref:glyoxalase n=1 Tax=Flavobacterium sp. TaxID=239 RepID=UPI00404A7779
MRDLKIESLIEDRLGKIYFDSSDEERFQNQTLRPILKFQNDLLILVMKNYIKKHKADFKSFTIAQKLSFFENSIQKDIKFRNSLKGMVIGLFQSTEYEDYIQNSSALNKRMMNLLLERYKSQVQLFESE